MSKEEHNRMNAVARQRRKYLSFTNDGIGTGPYFSFLMDIYYMQSFEDPHPTISTGTRFLSGRAKKHTPTPLFPVELEKRDYTENLIIKFDKKIILNFRRKVFHEKEKQHTQHMKK
ncbi:hypothetical protein [Methanomethylophilus alvi]|uniref:hypothetical protein n=1 Tax=Methanomethylophilus alvi TaxID=1291540 RepID=UPI0037DC8EA4